MGRVVRTTKLPLNLGKRSEGGANTGKRAYLEATVAVLNEARAFYVDFFLAHAEKFAERVSYFSEKHQEQRERAISAHELLTWAECCTVGTRGHSHPWAGWNFSERFPTMPVVYRGINSLQICGTNLDTAFVPPLSIQLAQRSCHIPSSEWIR